MSGDSSDEKGAARTEVERRAAELAAQATVAALGAGVERAAHGALDALEQMLFGRVGGAEDAVRREATADPLQRLREQYGTRPGDEPPKPRETAAGARESAEAAARKELADLKRRMAEKARPSDVPEVKKTL